LLLLQEWEGGVNIAMSNTVTTSIRSSVRGMAIGKTRTTNKADRATVENVNNNYFITFIVVYVTYSTRYLCNKELVPAFVSPVHCNYEGGKTQEGGLNCVFKS
jgi:hypothetical protein